MPRASVLVNVIIYEVALCKYRAHADDILLLAPSVLSLQQETRSTAELANRG